MDKVHQPIRKCLAGQVAKQETHNGALQRDLLGGPGHEGVGVGVGADIGILASSERVERVDTRLHSCQTVSIVENSFPPQATVTLPMLCLLA